MTSMHLRLMRQSTLRLRCKKAYVVFIGSRNLEYNEAERRVHIYAWWDIDHLVYVAMKEIPVYWFTEFEYNEAESLV